jgi:hypothetical protein
MPCYHCYDYILNLLVMLAASRQYCQIQGLGLKKTASVLAHTPDLESRSHCPQTALFESLAYE